MAAAVVVDVLGMGVGQVSELFGQNANKWKRSEIHQAELAQMLTTNRMLSTKVSINARMQIWTRNKYA